MSNSSLFEYCLRLGDTGLILGHRLSEWCGHGPILEEDIAMTNISLDLVGQSRAILAYAAEIEGKGRTEDDLAYRRDVHEYRNLMLTEQPNGDFAGTMMRLYLMSSYNVLLYEALRNSKNTTLAALAEKHLKEVTYHLRHAGEWILRLGDGTAESKSRTQQALDELWMFTAELFIPDQIEVQLCKEGIVPDMAKLKDTWTKQVFAHLEKATLNVPETNFIMQGSRMGKHTEHLGYILAEMQFLPRAYPDAKW